MWKCESTLIFFLVPSSTLLRGVEVWKSLTKVGYCHIFPPVTNPCHSLPSNTLLRGVEVWKSPTKSGYCHTFPQVSNPLSFFSYLNPSQRPVSKCGKVQQSQDIGAVFSQSQTPFYFYLVLTLLRGVQVCSSLTN